MTDLSNGGSEAAAKTADFARVADFIEGGDTFPPEASDTTEAESTSPRPWGFNIAEINRSYALAIWGGKAVVINEQPHGPVNDRVRVMSVEAMSSWFANRQTEVVGSDGKVKAVSWAKAWHSHRDRRQYDGVEFFPNPDGAPGTPNYLNFWRGFDIKPSPNGSYAIFRHHLLTNVCAGDEKLFNYVFGWIAHIVQKPRERLGTAIVLRGRRGTGKSKVGEVIGSLFSSHYFQVDDARYITGQFNAHMASCLLLQADEAVLGLARQALREMKGLDGKTPISVTPRHLVVGAAKETEAEQVLAAIAAAQVGDANPFSGKLTLHVEPRLTGNAWRLFADPGEITTMVIAYLAGNEGPQIEIRDGWNILGAEFRAVLDFGCAMQDWRGTYLNPGI